MNREARKRNLKELEKKPLTPARVLFFMPDTYNMSSISTAAYMMGLVEMGGGATTVELSDYFNTSTKHNLSAYVSGWERQGLVERSKVRSAKKGVVTHLTITPLGKDLVRTFFMLKDLKDKVEH